jgi:hypothetical protein
VKPQELCGFFGVHDLTGELCPVAKLLKALGFEVGDVFDNWVFFLRKIRKAGYVVFVEGESDTHTLL